jgi:hypothetical protein
MDYVVYATSAAFIVFLVLYCVLVSKYNKEKNEQNCTLGGVKVYSNTGATTLAAINVVNSAIRAAATGAAFSYTMPSAASIITHINTLDPTLCKPLTFTIINSSGQTISFIAGTGVTISGTVATANYATYRIDITSSTTVAYTLVITEVFPVLP